MIRRKQHKPAQAYCGLCNTVINNISVVRGRTVILSDISLEVNCGEFTALIGPNGGGKSTLLKAILGEIPHEGNIIFVNTKGSQNKRPIVGYVPQKIDLDPNAPTSVLDIFAALKTKIPVFLTSPKELKEEVRKSLSKVHAEHLIEKRLGDLSGGELQRVMLALALDPVPELLLLDEPISGMDEKGKQLFYDLVFEIKNSYHLAIILVSHDFHFVSRYADKVILLDKTVKCLGSPVEVFNDTKFKELFNMASMSILTS